MSSMSGRLGGRLVLQMAAIVGLSLFCSTMAAQATGSQAANIQFAQSWGPIPTGFNELNDYFAAPGYITLLELWAPG